MDAAIRFRMAGRVCSVETCTRPHYGHGARKRHYQSILRRERLRRLVELLGGRCQRCNGQYPHAVYDFHHRDPTEKKFSIGQAITDLSWDEVVAEAKKCDLLCANCHRIEHFVEAGDGDV